jgi:hypothetical protein
MIEIVTNIDKLRELALDQHGFVTYQQATDKGVTPQALSMLVKNVGVWSVWPTACIECHKFLPLPTTSL